MDTDTLKTNIIAPLFNPSPALRAQLRSGYRNSDYAISEIIDNAIEANAKNIDIFVIQGYTAPKKINGRKSFVIRRILIADDGSGIPPDIIGNVLSFGFGTHIDQTDTITKGKGKLGKFGYGLPNSSVATANDIHVWSWQKGIENCLHTSLNVPNILNGIETRQSPVTKRHLTQEIINLFSAIKSRPRESGTIIEWNDTVRCTWARINSLAAHVEETVGRIFRHFIDDGSVKIRIFSFNEKDLNLPNFTYDSMLNVRVNDPLFLMKNSAAHGMLDKHNNDPTLDLFVPYELPCSERKANSYWWVENGNTEVIKVDIDGPEPALVKIRYSITSEMFRKMYGQGAAVNKLVRNNSGVSICRSGRELMISQSWIPSQDSIERWWGAEIDFPPALDDYFGVTNNKQTAPILDEFANVDIEQYVAEYRERFNDPSIVSAIDVVEDMRDNDDIKWVSYLIRILIYQNSRKMYKDVKKIKAGALSSKDIADPKGSATKDKSAEPGAKVAEEVINNISNSGKGSDENQVQPESIEPTANKLLGNDVDEQTKLDVIEWLKSNKKVRFQKDENTGSENLFTVQEVKGKILIKLNTEHPAYDKLFGNLNMLVDDQSTDLETTKLNAVEIAAKLDEVRNIFSLLIYAMASVEVDPTYTAVDARILRRARNKYSEILTDLIDKYESIKDDLYTSTTLPKEYY